MSKSLEELISPHKFTPGIMSDERTFNELWNSQRDWVLSNLSHIAYFREDDVISYMRNLGATTIKFYSHDGAQAFLSTWDDKAILVFRGTQLMEHLPRKYEHLNFLQKFFIHILIRIPFNIFKLSLFNNDVIADLAFCHTRLTKQKGVAVHSGFLAETKKLWKKFIKDIRSLEEEQPLWVTGHSLGGAMATITAMKCPVKEVITFGEPRAGRKIQKVISNDMHTRYVNGNDIVTKVPPSLFSYYLHHGIKKPIANGDGSKDLLFDHSIINYSNNTYKNH
ncbi:MAG: lipase family protein [Gammaproteobacteria bacterium]|nr:lipase family protein [Gammaproteobacteria bacterium]